MSKIPKQAIIEELSKLVAMRDKARLRRDFISEIKLSQMIDALEDELRKETVAVSDIIKDAYADQVIEMTNTLTGLLFFCDAIDSLATDFKAQLVKISPDVIQSEIYDICNDIHKKAKKMVLDIDALGNKKLSERFGAMSDDIFPLVMNKIKKYNREDNKLIKAKYKKRNEVA